MILEKLSPHFWPATLAMIFSAIGWMGRPDRPVIYADAIPGLKITQALFAMPGVFVAAVMAMVFSPQLSWNGPIRVGHISSQSSYLFWSFYDFFSHTAASASLESDLPQSLQPMENEAKKDSDRPETKLNALDLALRDYPQYFRRGLGL